MIRKTLNNFCKNSGYVFLLFMFFAPCLNSQVYNSNVYGSSQYDEPYAIEQYPDSGLVIAGISQGDILIVRTNPLGDTIWSTHFGSAMTDYPFDISITIDGGCLISGLMDSGPPGATFQFFLAKVSASGSLLWYKYYNQGQGEGHAYKIIPFADSLSYLVIGTVAPSPTQQFEASVIKVDTSGNIIWSYTYGTNGNNEFFTAGLRATDGGFVLCGYRNGNDVLVVRIDSIGNLLWSKTYGGNGQDYAQDIVLHPGGGFIISGSTWSFGGSAFLLRLNQAGDTIWSKTYGGPANSEFARATCMVSNGTFVTGCGTASFSSSMDAWLFGVDSSGQLLWSRGYGGTGWEEVFAMTETNDGLAFAARDNSTSMLGYNSWIVRTDVYGNGLTCGEYATSAVQGNAPFVINAVTLNQQSSATATSTVYVAGHGCDVLPYCVTVAIDEKDVYGMRIFPVPAQESVIVELPDGFTATRLSVYDMRGTLALEPINTLGKKIIINISGLESGVYVIVVGGENGAILHEKIIIGSE